MWRKRRWTAKIFDVAYILANQAEIYVKKLLCEKKNLKYDKEYIYFIHIWFWKTLITKNIISRQIIGVADSNKSEFDLRIFLIKCLKLKIWVFQRVSRRLRYWTSDECLETGGLRLGSVLQIGLDHRQLVHFFKIGLHQGVVILQTNTFKNL